MVRNFLLLTLVLAGAAVVAYLKLIDDSRVFVFRSATAWRGSTPVKADRVLEWKIRIPETVVVRTDGYYHTAYEHGKAKSWIPWRRFPDGGSLLFMYSRLRKEDHFAPSNAEAGLGGGVTAITISNGKGLSGTHSWDYCITADERFSGTSSGCHRDLPGIVNCSIYMSYKGWPVDVGASVNSLYQRPTQACEIVKSILDSWTISIDDRRENSK